MKRLILGLFAMGMLAIAPATSVASNNNIVVANSPEGVKKVDPQAFTDKLVKELKLDKKQAKALLSLIQTMQMLLIVHMLREVVRRLKVTVSKVQVIARRLEAIVSKVQVIAIKVTENARRPTVIARWVQVIAKKGEAKKMR